MGASQKYDLYLAPSMGLDSIMCFFQATLLHLYAALLAQLCLCSMLYMSYSSASALLFSLLRVIIAQWP